MGANGNSVERSPSIPSYAYAHDQLNQMLGIIGRFDEAIAEGQRAVALDPLSPSILDDLATTLLYAGKTATALELARKAAELDPTFFFPPVYGRDSGAPDRQLSARRSRSSSGRGPWARRRS